MLAKKYRLTNAKDFKSLYKQKKAFYSSLFTIKCINNKLEHSRLAIVISKKNIVQAVQRNRQKRRLHSLMQKHWPSLKQNTDIVFFIKNKIIEVSDQEINKEIKKFLKQYNLIS